jgi:acyl transferase domain-containing protein
MAETLSTGGDPADILKGEYAQPLCAAVQIALVNLLASWGIHPTAVIGHSSGEMAAAYAAQSMTADQAILVAYYRGQVTKYHIGAGGMAAIGLGREAVLEFLEEGVMVACENSSQSVVVSGGEDALVRVLHRINMNQPGIFTSRLDVEVAYHSR